MIRMFLENFRTRRTLELGDVRSSNINLCSRTLSSALIPLQVPGMAQVRKRPNNVIPNPPSMDLYVSINQSIPIFLSFFISFFLPLSSIYLFCIYTSTHLSLSLASYLANYHPSLYFSLSLYLFFSLFYFINQFQSLYPLSPSLSLLLNQSILILVPLIQAARIWRITALLLRITTSRKRCAAVGSLEGECFLLSPCRMTFLSTCRRAPLWDSFLRQPFRAIRALALSLTTSLCASRGPRIMTHDMHKENLVAI